MPSSGLPSKYHSMGHFLSILQNTIFILEEVVRTTSQEPPVSIFESSERAMIAFPTRVKSGKIDLPFCVPQAPYLFNRWSQFHWEKGEAPEW